MFNEKEAKEYMSGKAILVMTRIDDILMETKIIDHDKDFAPYNPHFKTTELANLGRTQYISYEGNSSLPKRTYKKDILYVVVNWNTLDSLHKNIKKGIGIDLLSNDVRGELFDE